MIDGVGHGAPGARELAQQRVPVQQAGGARHLVVLLEDQPVGGAPGDLVQDVPGVQDRLVRGADPRPRGGSDPGGRDGLDRVHVPQTAPGLLEVGLEQEGQLAEDPGPFVMQVTQFGEPGPGRGPPVLQGTLAQLGRQGGVARDVPRAEQAEGDLDVSSRDTAGLGDGPHRVVQPRPGVPDRIPDPVRDRRDALAPGMQQ